jgi:hypothetical protein
MIRHLEARNGNRAGKAVGHDGLAAISAVRALIAFVMSYSAIGCLLFVSPGFLVAINCHELLYS